MTEYDKLTAQVAELKQRIEQLQRANWDLAKSVMRMTDKYYTCHNNVNKMISGLSWDKGAFNEMVDCLYLTSQGEDITNRVDEYREQHQTARQ